MSITVQTYTDRQYEVDYAAGIVGNENVNVKLKSNDVVCSDNLWPLWESCVLHFFHQPMFLRCCSQSQPLMLLLPLWTFPPTSDSVTPLCSCTSCAPS